MIEPFLTAYDPSDLPGGSVDPLGFDRIRAQTFEVLTGGDVAADSLEGEDDGEGAEGKEVGLEFPVVPPEMIRDLRVRLHVWESAGEALSDGAVA